MGSCFNISLLIGAYLAVYMVLEISWENAVKNLFIIIINNLTE